MADLELGKEIAFESECTYCGDKFNAASPIGEELDCRPSPGDLTICMTCGHPMFFDDNLKTRDLTEEEIKLIENDPRISAALKFKPLKQRRKH